MIAVCKIRHLIDDRKGTQMETQFTVHKYRDLSRWEFRYYDDNDGEIDMRHIVVRDMVSDTNFCVISFAELVDEKGAESRVRDYARIDAENLLSHDELRQIWTDAITRGVMVGLTRTRRHYSD